MKRINVIYIVAIALGIFLYSLYIQIKSDAAFFYGFAENKETEINHNKNVLIEDILVTTGQKVKAGDLLMVVKNTVLPLKINELELEKEMISINARKDIRQIKFKISDLQSAKINKVNELTAKINELHKEIELNTSLYEGLKSVKINNDTTLSPKEIEINYLVEKMNLLSQNYNQEIAYQEDILRSIENPTKLQNEILDTKISHFKNQQDKLSIYAPSDGIVGNILCKEKENITSFKTLLNFYQTNPTLVKGFVHESLLLQVKVGNELEVTSTMHAQHKTIGKVIGLGSRIVEIPERLRKTPDIKTYGREVLISISAKNNFLQKEKVMLNTILIK